MPYVRQRTRIQLAPRGFGAITWGNLQGLGQADVCSPGFVGPLTDQEQTICNLQAGISYRDALLGQGGEFGATGVTFSDFIKQHQGAILAVGAGIFGLAVLRGR